MKDFLLSEVKMHTATEPKCVPSEKQHISLFGKHEAEICSPGEANAMSDKNHTYVTSIQALMEAKKQAPNFLQCKLCDGIHPLYKCDVFKSLSLGERLSFAQQEMLCERCLRPGHDGYCVKDSCNRVCPSCLPRESVRHNSYLCPVKYEQDRWMKDMAGKEWADESWQ